MKNINLVDEKEIALMEQVNAVYVKKGMKAVTMDDMAKELHVSKKTLYKFVKNRSELVLKSTYFHVKRDQAQVEEIEAKNLSPIHEIHALIDHVIATLSNMNPRVHYDLEKYFPDAWKLLHEYFSGFVFQSVIRNLTRGQKDGTYRTSFKPEIIAKIFITKLDLVFDAELFPPDQFEFPNVYLEYVQYHLRGIVSDKGVKILNQLDFNK